MTSSCFDLVGPDPLADARLALEVLFFTEVPLPGGVIPCHAFKCVSDLFPEQYDAAWQALVDEGSVELFSEVPGVIMARRL